MATLKEGDNAPNFSLTDNEGKLRSLKDYFGKKLIISFIQEQIPQDVQLKPVILGIILRI